MNKYSIILLSWLSAACSAGDPASEGYEDTEKDSFSITNGTPLSSNSNYVAIYHRGSGDCNGTWTYQDKWWVRPCTGTVIRKDQDTNYVLTARHCVTTNGNIDGTTITDMSHLKLTSAVKPGDIDVNEENRLQPVIIGQPPTYAIPATQVHAKGIVKIPTPPSDDLAIIKVVGNLGPTHPPSLYPLYMGTGAGSGPEDGLVGTHLTAWGYGRNTAGHCYDHTTSGAGELRRGSYMFVTDVPIPPATPAFMVLHQATGTQDVVGGDSGGPLTLFNPQTGRNILAAVNSSSAEAVGPRVVLNFVQGVIGAIYLHHYDSLGSTVVGKKSGSNAVWIDRTEDSSNTRWRYNESTGQLKLTSLNLCVEDIGTVNVSLKTCDTTVAKQKWRLNGLNQQIVNTNTGRCLKKSSTSTAVVAGTCSTGDRWVITADNNML
jgi:hypothetical protein